MPTKAAEIAAFPSTVGQQGGAAFPAEPRLATTADLTSSFQIQNSERTPASQSELGPVGSLNISELSHLPKELTASYEDFKCWHI